jgi:SGNH domain (fused to AT3 domains)
VDVVLNGAVTDCAARNEATFILLRQHHVRQVILAGAWVQYLGDDNKVLRLSDGADASLHSTMVLSRQLDQTIRNLQNAGIDVVIVGPVPYIGWNVPSVLASSAWRGMAPPGGPQLGDFMARQRNVLAILGEAEQGAATIYPHERLCQSTCIVLLDGQVLYSDGEHLTTAGAELLQPMFVAKLHRLTRRSK